jgi:hypothetical protein
MRARKRGKLVYTEPGPGAYKKSVPTKPPEPRPIEPGEAEVATPRPPEALCPHGGIYIGGIAICQLCSSGDPKELVGTAFLYICKKAARIIKVSSETQDDATSTALLELAQPKNEKRITSATSPSAMAMKIAQDAIRKMYRSRSVQALPVSQWNLIEESVSGRLEYLTDYVPDADGNTRADEQWHQEILDRITAFPGIDLLWTSENLRWLQTTIDEARESLPKRPFSYWLVIDMRLGYSRDMDENTWPEIANILNITEPKARYAYRKARAMMKNYILERLTPKI